MIVLLWAIVEAIRGVRSVNELSSRRMRLPVPPTVEEAGGPALKGFASIEAEADCRFAACTHALSALLPSFLPCCSRPVTRNPLACTPKAD